MTEEMGKVISEARGDVQEAIDMTFYMAGEGRRLYGQTTPSELQNKFNMSVRKPFGVCGIITPWNFPMAIPSWKIMPAVVSGNTVVFKPATFTPRMAVRFVEVMEEAGIPDGVVNLVLGGGSDVGNALVEHAGVAYVTFTGSSEVGWGIAAKAGRKKVALELGNNSPVIIEADGDWQKAAGAIATAGFSHAGQSCVSVQRVYVAAPVAGDFTALLAGLVDDLVVGDPMDDATDVSALISTEERDRVASWIDEAVAGGAKIAAGGDVVTVAAAGGGEAGVLRPTVLTGVTQGMRVSRDEVFGPVVAIQAYDSLDEALRLADDTRYGLQAGIFTASLASALRAARELRFGTVLVNEVPTWRADQMPYGGVRESGNTKEGPAYAVRQMTEERLIVIQP
jgi:acyl-CoA reductase-like NAD-dependent aldehyde dehydrogenase